MTSLFKFGETRSTGLFGVVGSSTQDETLRNIFNSGQYHDLTVVAKDGRDFKVHKNEGATSRIELPESADIVHAILGHIYGLPESACLSKPSPNPRFGGVIEEDTKTSQLFCVVRIYFAADKYDLPKLKSLAKTAYEARLYEALALDAMTVAALVYDNTPENDVGIRSETCRYVRLHLTSIMADEPARTELLNNKGLLQDLLTRLGVCMQEYRNTTAKLSYMQ
ncbi:hypothetical protein LTR16_006486 [Cryomyces antarcticus]|uniref:BTB domain-containing protein n=1 Tax=Cryomyces antarcticus TaxID=329879 RepID=A0ABR0KQD6_9PEZI|nr:hypothetical protein LTR16_006486 [Cryomyces antarcticus]